MVNFLELQIKILNLSFIKFLFKKGKLHKILKNKLFIVFLLIFLSPKTKYFLVNQQNDDQLKKTIIKKRERKNVEVEVVKE